MLYQCQSNIGVVVCFTYNLNGLNVTTHGSFGEQSFPCFHRRRFEGSTWRYFSTRQRSVNTIVALRMYRKMTGVRPRKNCAVIAATYPQKIRIRKRVLLPSTERVCKSLAMEKGQEAPQQISIKASNSSIFMVFLLSGLKVWGEKVAHKRRRITGGDRIGAWWLCLRCQRFSTVPTDFSFAEVALTGK